MTRRIRTSIVSKIFVCVYGIILLIVSNPYCYFGVMLHPLRVTLFLDIPDRDEDIFVHAASEEYTDEAWYEYEYKEESRRDGDRNDKLSFKIKLDTTLSETSFFFSSDTYVTIELLRLSDYVLSFTTPFFHPPNLPARMTT